MTGTAALPSKGGDARQSEHREGVMFGRFMLADLTEHPCRVSDLSVYGATFLTEVDVEPLAQLVAISRMSAGSRARSSAPFPVASVSASN